MQTALKTVVTVLPGGRIELTDAELPAGETVDVIVLLRQDSSMPILTLAASLKPLELHKSDAEYEAEADILLDKMKVMLEEMQQDRPEIDAIRVKTKTSLADIKRILDEMDRRRNENTL